MEKKENKEEEQEEEETKFRAAAAELGLRAVSAAHTSGAGPLTATSFA
jgi:hypothetical protein